MDKNLIWATAIVIVALLAAIVLVNDASTRGQFLTLLDVLVSALVGGAAGLVLGRRAAVMEIRRAVGDRTS